MTLLNPSLIRHWHAHVYFDASSRQDAWALREAIATGSLPDQSKFKSTFMACERSAASAKARAESR